MSSQTARELLGAALTRLLEQRAECEGREVREIEADLGEHLGLAAASRAHAASNLRKIIRGGRWPGPAVLDGLADWLGVHVHELFEP